MTKVRAIRDFPGSTVRPDGTGVVEKGFEFDCTENTAVYLEREGLVERVLEEPAAAGTPTPGEVGSTAREPTSPPPSTTGTNTD